MIGLREVVFNLIKSDPQMNALGYGPGTLFGANSVDSSPAERFGIITWEDEIKALGSRRAGDRLAKERPVQFWAYDRSRDYGQINAAIARWCILMDSLPTLNTGAGSVISSEWTGDSRESFDDVYQRIFRSSAYTIIATGD